MKFAALACAIAIALVACSKVDRTATQHGRHDWSRAGILRVAVIEEPRTLNPLLPTNSVDGFVDRLLFSGLLSADPRGNPVPMLAERAPTQANGGISRDGLTITYRLRRDALWSDGVPVEAGDVVWSWRAILNPRNNVISRHGYDVIRSIDTPDAHTVVVHLKHRFAPFVNTFFAESDQPYEVAPSHVLRAYPDINRVPLNNAPGVGDGPFRFVSWTHGDRIVVARNERFFKGRPRLSRVEIQFVPNEDTAVNLLRTHAIDYIYQASIDTFPAVSALPDARVVWTDMNGFEAIEFNLSHPATADVRVRRAIASAIDKAEFVRRLTHGQEKIATEDLPDWMWAFDPSVRPPAFDVSSARSALMSAGYSYSSDGSARKNGVPLQLLLATDNANVTHREESLLVQEALHRIGVDVTIKYYPQAILYEPAASGGIVQGGKFDLTLAPWYAGVDPDDSSQFTCAAVPPNGYNTSRYCSSEMESAQRDVLSHYDQALRAVAYGRVQRTLARDVPYVFLWWQRQMEPISVDFKGFAPNPATESWNAWEWSI
ncbi:MAG TPA: peptide ABC transporter substrate-binding protein [Candidatus Tumulicola sp.]